MSEPDSFLNGPSSILIASPLRLPELKSSLFTDEFRCLAKEYMTNFKFLDPALDNVSQGKLLYNDFAVVSLFAIKIITI